MPETCCSPFHCSSGFGRDPSTQLDRRTDHPLEAVLPFSQSTSGHDPPRASSVAQSGIPIEAPSGLVVEQTQQRTSLVFCTSPPQPQLSVARGTIGPDAGLEWFSPVKLEKRRFHALVGSPQISLVHFMTCRKVCCYD